MYNLAAYMKLLIHVYVQTYVYRFYTQIPGSRSHVFHLSLANSCSMLSFVEKLSDSNACSFHQTL